MRMTQTEKEIRELVFSLWAAELIKGFVWAIIIIMPIRLLLWWL